MEGIIHQGVSSLEIIILALIIIAFIKGWKHGYEISVLEED